MLNIIYTVRKQGVVKVANKQEAQAIINAAAEQGYTFGYQKQGWNNLVVDLDA